MKSLKEILRNFARKFYCYIRYIRHNRNYNPTIISSNCIGGVVSHDMNLKFFSPTVNLWMFPNDFVKFCTNIDFYLEQKFEWIKSDVDCPTGRLNDITIYFLHYHNEKEAERKWNERKKRINYNNLFFVMTDRDGCTYEDLVAFDKLSCCKNKVVFVHKEYPEIKSAFVLKKFAKENQVGVITNFNKFSYYRDLDKFDWISFLNM